MKRLTVTLAAALAATLVAAPVAAQQPKVVTAPGVNGQPACPGGITATHLDDAGIGHLVIPNGAGNIAIQANPFGFITYSSLRGRIGDGSTTSFPMRIRVINTRTGSQVHDVAAGTIDSTNTSTGVTVNLAVASTTPYSVIYYANVTNLGPTRQESTSCFMTGGPYTINNVGSDNFINQAWNMAKRVADLSNECTIDGQLGNRAARESEALANLNRSFGSQANYNTMTSQATCNSKCDERFPRSDSASNAAKNACRNQCAAARSSIPTWATLLAAEVAAIERTFDPGKCRAPEADQPQSNGCYSISPRTQLDVYNCQCGLSPRPSGFNAGSFTAGCDGS